jgi:hypothetical protein
MEKILLTLLDYLIRVVLATAIQLLVLLGPLLILAIIMNLISNQIRNLATRVFGEKAFVYGFKWLGTPIHETGHALFALIFGHKINEIKFFDPDATDGSYGYVNHSYTPGNIYQEIGKFFIGIGPILMGSLMLYLITYLLFRFSASDVTGIAINSSSVTDLSSLKTVALGIAGGFGNYMALVFHGNHSAWWKILLMIYLLFSIGSSLTLSPPDIKGALSGFFFFVVVLLLFNLVTLWIGNFATGALAKTSTLFSGFYMLMILSIMINGLFAVVLAILIPVTNMVRRKVRGY